MPSREECEEWGDLFKKYIDKLHHGRYLKQHYYDSRNTDIVETKIQLDKDSRECISYLKALIEHIDKVRIEAGLEYLE